MSPPEAPMAALPQRGAAAEEIFPAQAGLAAKKKPLVPAKIDKPADAASPTLSAQTNTLIPHPRPSTPNLQSAASSMIFERDVQEPVVTNDMTPAMAIPAHIKTDDLIPPALEASSLAITDDHLRPEEVEIITHVTHQPAAATIAQNISTGTCVHLSPQDSHEQHIFHTQESLDDAASSYGALDPNDVRRLSFISFADVVHGDQTSLHPPSLPTDSSFSQPSRPISPVRSPLSTNSQLFSTDVGSPPTSASISGSAKGAELSPSRSMNASPTTAPAVPVHRGELAIETLSQALRKTASRDLSGISRSPPPTSASG